MAPRPSGWAGCSRDGGCQGWPHSQLRLTGAAAQMNVHQSLNHAPALPALVAHAWLAQPSGLPRLLGASGLNLDSLLVCAQAQAGECL